MNKAVIFLLLMVFALSSFGQAFEGKIVYENRFKSKIPKLSDEQLSSMMGSKMDYFIKKGSYKSVSNGSLMQWQLYINKENRIYTKMTNSDSAFWQDGAINTSAVVQAEMRKNVVEILGYKCDELVFILKDGSERYFYNEGLSAEVNSFSRHEFGNWKNLLTRSRSLPLKMVIDNSQFSLESIAVEVKPMTLDDEFFKLPKGIKTAEGPNN